MNDYPPEGYDVNEKGEVINLKTGYVLKYKYNTYNYCYVKMRNKNYLVHRLVATKYIPNPDNKPQVNHIDGNKENNHVSNLEWVTPQENKTHAKNHKLVAVGEKINHSKLTEEDVRFIRQMLRKP